MKSNEGVLRGEGGIIYLQDFITDGISGSSWMTRLQKEGYRLSDCVESVLCSSRFVPTKDISRKTVILKGELWNESERTLRKVREDVCCSDKFFIDEKKITSPTIEDICWIRLLCPDDKIKQMGLEWIVFMLNEPIRDNDNNPRLLVVTTLGSGSSLIDQRYVGLDVPCARNVGFVFIVD